MTLRKRYRRALGRYRRLRHWEFWPAWAVYSLVAPTILTGMVRHRSATVFAAANPGIPKGGFVGESKWDIYRRLGAPEDPRLPRMVLLRATMSAAARMGSALGLVDAVGWPVVVKPDTGYRSRGVNVVRDAVLLERLVSVPERDLLVQEYLPGQEYGVFWIRHPDEGTGRIVSIARKELLTVSGDGRRDLETLILDDERAVCLWPRHLRVHAARLRDVPAAGEVVPLVELGCHHQGAVFRDIRHVETAALRAVIAELCDGFEGGFHLGRFDLRAADDDALARGEIRIIELNGVFAEPLHIFDPRHSLREPISALRDQWRQAFEIGAINRQAGVEVPSARRVISFVRREAAALRLLDRTSAAERGAWERGRNVGS